MARLSLQCHHHCAKRWVVIESTAAIPVDEAVTKVEPGDRLAEDDRLRMTAPWQP